jgi:hypothetical protein
VIHPPVGTDRFATGRTEDFFLVVGDLSGTSVWISRLRLPDELERR